jgi:hypothetical protein
MDTRPERTAPNKKQEILLNPESKSAWHTPELNKSELRGATNTGFLGAQADFTNTTTANNTLAS